MANRSIPNKADCYVAHQPQRGAQPWGEESLWLCFAGAYYGVDGLSQRQARSIAQRYGSLCRQPGAEDRVAARVQMIRAAGEEFPEWDCGGEYVMQLDYTAEGVHVRGLRFAARLRVGTPLEATLYTPDDGDAYFEGAFENLFRIAVAYALMEVGGALLHSAGVLVKGRAHILFGPSGAGKSTVSRMSHGLGFKVLSDELNGLEPKPDGGVHVAQLPFAGDFGRQAPSLERHSLGSVMRLYQSTAVRIEPMSRAAALASLFAAAPFVNGDPYRGHRLLDNLQRLVLSFEPRALHFTLAPVFWKEVLRYDSRHAPGKSPSVDPESTLSCDR